MSRVQTHPIQRIHQAGKEEQNCDVSEEEDDLSQTSSQLFASSPAGSWSSQDTGVTSTPDLLPLHNLQTNVSLLFYFRHSRKTETKPCEIGIYITKTYVLGDGDYNRNEITDLTPTARNVGATRLCQNVFGRKR